jgi:hypothetical protein
MSHANLMAVRLLSAIALASVVLLSGCGGGSSDSRVNGADPAVLEAPVAYIKRPIPVDDQGQAIQADLREPRLFSAGGDLYLRDNSTSTAAGRNVTALVTLGTGDVKGVNVSFDGTKVIFSLRLFDPNPNDDDTPTWNIYEYDLSNDLLRRIISDDLLAEQGDDLFPTYLPDDRIVFTSSRQRQSAEVLSNEGRTRFSALDENGNTIALVLHVMNSDGSEVHQISFNQSHDLNPIVLSNNASGKILFSRWDGTASNSEYNIYRVNPDGSEQELLYGAHSHATGTNNTNIQFSRMRETPDGNLMAITMPFTGTFDGGNIVTINSNDFADNNRPIWSMNGLAGPAQAAATINNVTNDNSISLSGRYRSAFPLWDGTNRILASKSSCQIVVSGINRPCIQPWIADTTSEEVSPSYALWLYDPANATEKVVVRAETGMVITEGVVLQSRVLPNIIRDNAAAEYNAIQAGDGIGVVNIKSVYDFSDTTFNGCFLNVCTSAPDITNVNDLGDPLKATALQRPARFVRFVKAVALPDSDDPTLVNPPDLSNSAFGPQRNLGMREIVGYAPVEPDGSIKVKVPANIPLAVEVLDEFGRRMGPRHDNWFQVRPGNTVTCSGCHTHITTGDVTPFIHSRISANAPSINSGLPVSLIFGNTQIPGTSEAYWGNLAQTMAEVRFDRVGSTVPPSAQPQLMSDLVYDDVWTNPAVRPLDTSVAYRYSGLNVSSPSPATVACSPWNFKCRIVINYERQIHPIWSVDRGADVNPANGMGDNTCTECHSNETAAVPRVPAGQLDLTDGPSDINADRLKSYQELFFTDAGQELDAAGLLVNIQITQPVLDGNGDPVVPPLTEMIDDPAERVFGTMSATGARRSYFIEKLTETELDAGRALSTIGADPNYKNHAGLLTNDELRMISEWLDLGAQYFNDPFDPTAPQN